MSAQRGPKRRRLSRSAEFERVYRQGRSKGNRYLVLYAFPRAEDREEGPRLGLSVGRRVGGAVERSRVKRVLREAFWEEAARLPTSSDYVVVARPGALPLAEREGTAAGGRVRAAAVGVIRAYQRVVSPLLPRRCKYHPTCSAYAVQAIGTYGILRGSVLAAWRVLRCNPFSHGGYDPLSAQTLFRAAEPPASHSQLT